ncbi:MFS general substrate transporter [Glarea lozoyensis ATCC 20868]|uniref:MFS general substrate transporter n=1 Tax=Glarea lozoyensis (strain ATCC 20868 / MF5171) TaxID=1116229 RepID=S3CHR4_GLAL2|nr:MFS general substrate transporter [Glarea lozoyensis ATCC 20868]EPE26017.1 MFS general substrate transporter [Glarea lozoyensis ATCC 20868]
MSSMDDEKREMGSSTAGFPTRTSTSRDHVEKELHISPRNSHSSSSSDDSRDSDPLSPLERALTPNLFTEAEQTARPDLTQTQTGTSFATTGSRIPSFEVDFTENDPDDPRSWPLWYRGMITFSVSFATLVVVMYSTSYTSSMPGMMKEFGVESEPVATLGVTMYLLGLAVGSLVLAPLSEIYGRRPVYIGALAAFCLLVLPCALATSLAEVLVVRFFGALAGAAMISNSPGTVSDIVDDSHRALAFSIWSIGPMNGPVVGPVIGGFAAEYLGWRWTNWIVMILAGVAWMMCAMIKETYAPSILKRKAAKMRKETGDDRYWCRYDNHMSLLQLFKVNLSRPFVLSFTEPILWFWNAYIAIIYGILYLCFVAYPLIYSGERGWSQGFTGLSFVGIGVGTMIAIATEPFARRVINSHPKDPETGRPYPEASVSIICFASFLCPIGQIWFSWTATPVTIHWIWPILAGVPFGAGNCLVFIYASNYLAGSYGIYAASALAGNAVVRSALGGTLPLAGPAMYKALTPHWAGTLLGLVQIALIPIPFVFYKWGDRIRARSPMIKQMREDNEKGQKRAARAKRHQERLALERGEIKGDENAVIDVENNAVEKTIEARASEKL